MTGSIPVAVLQSELLPLALGLLVTAAGAMACAVFALRFKQRDWPLLYFGMVALMFGARLEATSATAGYFVSTGARGWLDSVVTGFIPLPFTLFFLTILLPNYRRLRMWLGVLLAVQGSLYTLAQVNAHAAQVANRVNSVVVLTALPLVLLLLFNPRRPSTQELWIIRVGVLSHLCFALYTNAVSLGLIHGNPGLEYLGFTILLGCLGYVALRRALHREERLDAINRELALAQRIQSRLLPGGVAVKGVVVATRYVPVAWVAGDFYDFLLREPQGIGVLIADVAGHGVPAALAASMVKIAIRAQAHHAENPGAVLRGMNEILLGNVDTQFVTAAYLYIDLQRHELMYSAAGHPPMLLWRAAEGRVEAIEENGLFLGAFAESAYSTRRLTLAKGDRCLLYTDGIVEAPNPAGEEFGSQRLQAFVEEFAPLPPEGFCDALLARVETWCGRREGTEQHDDLTLLVVEFVGESASGE